MKSLKQRFEKAVDDLYQVNDYLAAEATKLGYPIYSKQIPTAGVRWDPDKKKVIFAFNEEFCKDLSEEDFMFLVAHEAMHVINLHIFLLHDIINDMIAKKKTAKDIKQFRDKFGIAIDCVVNDSAVNLYGLPPLKYLGKAKIPGFDGKPIEIDNPVVYGKDFIGCDSHDMTAMEVYYLLPDNKNYSNLGSDDHEWSSFFDDDGDANEDFIEKIKQFIDKNIENSAMSDKELNQVSKMKETLKESRDSKARSAGTDAGNQLRPINRLGNNTLQWDRIVQQFVPTKKNMDVWNRPNRKMVSVYPKVVLPSFTNDEKKEIFVAIDKSGSIDQTAFQLFMDVVRNTPANYIVRCITFDTVCKSYDPKGNEEVYGGGGTDFQIIEDYIQQNLKDYPKAVFVLTDGEGTFVHPKHPKKWCWLLYGSCSTHYIADMKHYNIKDMLR